MIDYASVSVGNYTHLSDMINMFWLKFVPSCCVFVFMLKVQQHQQWLGWSQT